MPIDSRTLSGCAAEADGIVLPLWRSSSIPVSPSSSPLLLAFIGADTVAIAPSPLPQLPQPPSAFCSPRVFQNTENFPQSSSSLATCHFLVSFLFQEISPGSGGLWPLCGSILSGMRPAWVAEGSAGISTSAASSKPSTWFLTGALHLRVYKVLSVINNDSKNNSHPCMLSTTCCIGENLRLPNLPSVTSFVS